MQRRIMSERLAQMKETNGWSTSPREIRDIIYDLDEAYAEIAALREKVALSIEALRTQAEAIEKFKREVATLKSMLDAK